VSDQIENEDMLDTATDGKEKPEEERNDVAEEDNGIEMSDDFDSHLQVRRIQIFSLRGPKVAFISDVNLCQCFGSVFI
jgi:hypothetical protein